MANVFVTATPVDVNVNTTVSNVIVTDTETGTVVNVSVSDSVVAVTSTPVNVSVGPSTDVSNAQIRAALSADLPIIYDEDNGIFGFDGSTSQITAGSLISLSSLSVGTTADIGGHLTANSVAVNTSISAADLSVTGDIAFGGGNIINGDFSIDGNITTDGDIVTTGNITGTLKNFDITFHDAGDVGGNVVLDLANGNVQRIRLINNLTGLTFTGVTSSTPITVIIEQDNVGFWQIDTDSFPANWSDWLFVNNFTTLSTQPADRDLLSVNYDGTNYYASVVNFFQSLITNAELANSNVVINNITIPLGSNSTLTTENIPEGGSNVYFTALRVRSNVSAQAPILYNSTTGVFSFNTNDQLNLGGLNLNGSNQFPGISLIVNRNNSDAALFRGNVVIEPETAPNEQVSLKIQTNPPGGGAIRRDLFHAFGVGDTQTVAINGNLIHDLGNIVSTGTVIANSFVGDGSQLTGISTLSNAQVVAHIATVPLTVGGNLTVNGNINATGNINVQNVEDLYVRDQIIVLNANAASPANVQIISNRPGLANTDIKWNEQTARWTFTNDGTTYYNLAESTTDVAEGTNLYYSNARVNAFIQDNITTTDISEGTNLYFTDARANSAIDARVNTAFVNGLAVDYNSLANTPVNVSAFTNDAGYLVAANLTSLTANVDSVNGQTGVVVLDTGDISEGTNLYFTTDRANTAIGAYQGSINTTGNIETTGNIQGDYILGNGAFLTGIVGGGTYGDANVETLLDSGTLTSNIETTGNIIGAFLYGDGSNITGIAGGGTVTQIDTGENLTGGPITSTGTISMSNVLANVNSITAETGTSFTVNTNGSMLVRQPKGSAGTLTPAANIVGEGYGLMVSNTNWTGPGAPARMQNTANADFVTHTASSTTTEGSNEIAVTNVLVFRGSTSAAVSDLKVGDAIADALGALTSFPFPPGTYVTAVDAGNSTVTVNNNAAASTTATLFYSPGMVDTTTGLVMRIVSLFDVANASKKIIASLLPMNTVFAYPETGPEPADFDVLSIGVSSDYNKLTDWTPYLTAKTSITPVKTLPRFDNGVLIGPANPTNRGESDQIKSWGLSMLWDGTANVSQEYGNNLPFAQMLFRQYSDSSQLSINKTLAGPRLLFSSANGNINDNPFATYPTANQELGRILWWGTSGTLTNMSTTAPPAYISALAANDWDNAGNDNINVGFVATSNKSAEGRVHYLTFVNGELIFTSGRKPDNSEQGKIRFVRDAALTGVSSNVNSVPELISGDLVNISSANTVSRSGSQLTVTNGAAIGAGTVGDMIVSLDRLDNSTTGNVVYQVPTLTFINVAAAGEFGQDTDMVRLGTTNTLAPFTEGFVTINGYPSPVGAFINGNTYYGVVQGGFPGGFYIRLYTDATTTTPVATGLSTGLYNPPGTVEYVANFPSGVTAKRWAFTLPEQSNSMVISYDGTEHSVFSDNGNLSVAGIITGTGVEAAYGTFSGNVGAQTFIGSGVEAFYGTFGGNVAAQTFLGNIEGVSGDFTGTVTAGAFAGDGSDITDVRAKTVEEKVINKSGGTLPKGTPVFATGGVTADALWVAACDASNAATMPCIGVLSTALLDDAEGRAIVVGAIGGVNTSAFSAGDEIFVAVGGGYANVAPAGESNVAQYMGIVTRVNATQGGGVVNLAPPRDQSNLNTGNIFVGDAGNVTVSQPLGTAITDANVKLRQFAETVVSLGNVSGDISSNIDVSTGTIYQLTATGGITINSLANAGAGTSATVIVTQDGTGGHTLNSTMLYAGGDKTLSTGANAVDIISVFYDGTTYYATLSKGYA